MVTGASQISPLYILRHNFLFPALIFFSNVTRKHFVAAAILVFLVSSGAYSETDSTNTADTTANADSNTYTVEDSTGDSARVIGPLPDTLYDSLSDTTQEIPDTAQIADEPEKHDVVRKPPFRFMRYCENVLLKSRHSLKEDIERSHYHDAGDFFRSDRAFHTIDYSSVPLRHTVSPFGINGARLTTIFDGRDLNPLEHIIEPDGLSDFHDIPTASVGEVYSLYGPLASFMGGRNGIGAVWLSKVRPSDSAPESRMEAQVGSFGYSFTKGIISERTSSGFEYTAALGFRKLEFFGLPRDDENHQFWEIGAPLTKRLTLTGSVRLYRREADYTYRPKSVAVQFTRDRRDREYVIRLEKTFENDATFGVKMRHQSSHSITTGLASAYQSDLKWRDNSLALTREWRSGGGAYQVALVGGRERFKLFPTDTSRNHGEVFIRTLGGNASGAGWKYFASAGLVAYQELSILPRMSAGLIYNSRSFESNLSLALTPVYPRQYELFFPLDSPAVGTGSFDLSEEGNQSLREERQYTASAGLSVKGSKSRLDLNLIGGSARNAINWRVFPQAGGGGGNNFRPMNETYDFLSVGISAQYELFKWATWYSSAWRYHLAYESTLVAPYSPEYNLATGLEVRYYLEPLGMDLAGHMELGFAGEYFGHDGDSLGREPLVNAKATVGIKKFKFHYVFENVLDRLYQAREQYDIPGRYSWYWITWDFLD